MHANTQTNDRTATEQLPDRADDAINDVIATARSVRPEDVPAGEEVAA